MCQNPRMGILRRSNPKVGQDPEPLSDLLLQGQDMMLQMEQAHQRRGIGSADRWDLDQNTGVITWTFPERTAHADAQVPGSFSPASATWKWAWAWANGSILPALSVASRTVDRGHSSTATPS